MAKPRKYTTPKTPASRGERDAWTQAMLERANAAFSFDTEQRRMARDDMKFALVQGNQWDEHLTKKRRNKPCYEFNRTRQMVRRITGQMLKNKPQIKVRAVEDNDVDTAEIYNGLIKNIEVQSSAEVAYDTAAQWQVGGGLGVLQVVAEYEGYDTFDQCLKIKAVDDPVTSWWPDPSAKAFDRSDARYHFITSTVSREAYEKQWPSKPVADFNAAGMDTFDRDWCFEDDVRIASYWYLEDEEKRIYLLSDGSVTDADEFDPIKDELSAGVPGPDGQPTQPPLTVVQERKVTKPCVYSCLVSGAGKLEEPKKWGGSMIPIVPQWGDFVTIEGKQHWCGMTRFARDAQMVHNFEQSTAVEVLAKTPNSPLTATPAMMKGLESYYERMGYDDPPVLPFNIDPANPNSRPQREMPATFPAAFVQMAQVATDELKAVTGVYDASLGNRSNESSGRAIIARQTESEVSNFIYPDNQVKAIKRLGDILVDAIPAYYDSERSIRILGADNAEKYIRINKVTVDQQTGETYTVNDLSRGKYDVVATVGKSFDTARMELAETAQALSQIPGPIGALGQFMLLKSLDVQGIDEYVKAARKVLVGQKLLEPSEGDQPPPAPQPNPKDVADAKVKDAQAKKYAAEAEGQDLENMQVATQMGMAMGELGLPMFGQPEQSMAPEQGAMPNGFPPAGLPQ